MPTTGTDDSGHIAFGLLNQLMLALVAKGVLTEADVTGILRAFVKDESADKSFAAQRSVAYVRDIMLKN